MKKTSLYAAALALCLGVQGCGTKSAFIREPFGEYVSDATFFRAVGQGKDRDMQRARSKALHNAKVDIARSAHSVCRMVAVNYLDQAAANADISLREQFVSVSAESVNRALVHVETEDAVYSRDKSGEYTCHAKVRVKKDHVLDTFAGDIKEKTALDEALFRQVAGRAVTQINTDRP
jgi:hypothetical protein